MEINLCDKCMADCRHEIPTDQIVVMCGSFKERITNADRIRSMTDEQLLDFMVKTIGNAVTCQALGTEPKFCTLEWLQSPVEDGKGDVS